MQKRSLKKCAFFILLSLSLSLFSSFFSYAAVEEFPDTSGAQSVYLWNAEYDEILLYKSDGTGEDNLIFPSTTVKLMTGLVAIELIGDRLDEKVIISSEMIKGVGGTSMGLKAGEVVSFRDLLYGALCSGFNDAANALAATSAGSVSAFVEKMNEKAEALGAVHTHYTNPTGWHDDRMVTTLHDTARIAKAAMKNTLFVEVSSAPTYELSATNKSDGATLHNRNGLIGSHYAIGYYNKRAEGLCAGMTDEGGYCVATFARYEDLTYLCIVMGAQEKNGIIGSYALANELITHAIYYYDEVDALRAGDRIASVPLRYAQKTRSEENDYYMLPCSVPHDVTVFACFDYREGYELEFEPYFFSDILTAPVEEGERVGGVDIYVNGRLCGTAPLCADESVGANPFLRGMDSAKDVLASRGAIAFAITFLLSFSIYFYFAELRSLQKKKRKYHFDRPF